jgi:putative endopeptidase
MGNRFRRNRLVYLTLVCLGTAAAASLLQRGHAQAGRVGAADDPAGSSAGAWRTSAQTLAATSQPAEPRPSTSSELRCDDPIARIRDEGLNHSQVMQTLSYLSDVIGPRLTGSPNLRRANEWTRQTMASWGLANSHLEQWGPFGRGWSLQRFSMQVIEPQTIVLTAYPRAWSPGFDGPFDARVVYLDASDEADLQRFHGKLKGAVVLEGAVRDIQARFQALATRLSDDDLSQLADAPEANLSPPGQARGMTAGERRTLFATTTAGRRLMADAVMSLSKGAVPRPSGAIGSLSERRILAFLDQEGAALAVSPSLQGDGGTIFVAGALTPGQPGTRRWRNAPRAWSLDGPHILPQVVLAVEQYNRLVRMTRAGEKLKMSVDLQVRYYDDDPMAYNTIAEIPGSDLKDEIVMLGGHLDSWHSGTGATDNGAGVAAAMEAVRILATLKLHPRRTIRIGLWTGEEEGLLGSTAYVTEHFGSLSDGAAGSGSLRRAGPDGSTSRLVRAVVRRNEYDKFCVYLNLDNGAGKVRGVYLQGDEAARPVFRRWLQPLADLDAATLTSSSAGGTDHISFDLIGLPGFQFIQDPLEYFSRTHHSNADVFDRIQADDLKQASTVMAALIYQAAMMDGHFPRMAVPALYPSTAAADAAALPDSGIDRANFDTSVRPADDFYKYVNGTWIRNNPIPPEYSRWGAFPKLRDENLLALLQIVDGLANQKTPLDEDSRKLRDFFRAAMDEARLKQDGATPLDDDLHQIGAAADREALAGLIGHLNASGVPALFGISVAQDERQSDRYVVHLRQGGLGLPERSYYLGGSDDSKRILAEYRGHVARMLTLLGETPVAAAADADTVVRIETRLAEASRDPVKLRDREAQYNKKSMAEMSSLTPNLNWATYLKAIDAPHVSEVIVGQPEFFQRVNDMLGDVPPADWRVYLRWHLVHTEAGYLSDPFADEDFRFYSGVLRGVKEMQPRWKRAIGAIDRLMGEALGRLYVERHFPPQSKARMDEMVKNVLAAYRERIESRQWMGDETKKQALEKLAAVTPKIGYPDHWRDYSELKIGDDSYGHIAMQAQAFDFHYRISRLGKPVDRNEWGMTPPTVNAYYNSTMNEIVFPAGILQPPFFTPDADDAVNYGAIGAVIGHEITHGFDDQGSRSDAKGNLKNWWTPDDRARFTALTDKLAAEFDACVAVDDLHVNGRLTLGENIADLGGVAISYAAWQHSLGGKPAPVIDGFTGPQRFFIGFAQVWRGSTRDADARVLLRTDPHSPPRFRTLVPLSNIQAFYDAFDVKPGDAMYRAPEDRVEIW